MKTLKFAASFVFAIAFSVWISTAYAVDAAAVQPADSYATYQARIQPLVEELYAKEAELGAILDSPERNDARVQQLYTDIGQIRGKLAVANTDVASAYPMRHGGWVQGDDSGYAHHGGYRGHRRGGRGWGHRGGGWGCW